MAIVWILLGAGIFFGTMLWLYRWSWSGCDPFDIDGPCE